MIKNATQIREDANIVDIVGKYVTLKRRGATYVGLCPFHTENSPSFTVFPASNTFKCFGCGQGGDAVHFLMESQSMTFPEALELVASESRIEIEYENRERRQEDLDRAKAEQERRHQLSEMLNGVHRYYADNNPLPALYCDLESRREMVDADGRVISRETADRFGICYTPDDNAVRKAGFWDAGQLTEIGVLGKGDYGEYDFFKRRLIFRITDHRGKAIGLAGRRLRSEDHNPQSAPTGGGDGGGAKQRAKYINSKESLLYRKSEVLFGLYENRRGIKDAGFAVLVEGYMDVVTPHDYGVCNHVAPCGTALTDQQANLLKRYTDEVLILRDGDQAGLEAAKRDVETLARAGLKVRICVMQPPADAAKAIEEQKADIFHQEKTQEELIAKEPKSDKKPSKNDPVVRSERLLEGMKQKLARMQAELAAYKDPDTFIRHHNRSGYEFFLEEKSQDAIIWRVMCEYDPDDVFKKDMATQVAAQLISLIESETLREFYIKELTSNKNLGSVKRILTDAIKQFGTEKNKKSDLTPKQKQDVIKYGLYEKDNCYFIAYDINATGFDISNFVIRPIILIEGAKQSIRLIEVVNQHGASRILDINSRNFVTAQNFQNEIEARGNFLYKGEAKYFVRIKSKVYDEMPTAYPIYTMGLHREGFWTWANGISIEGKFFPVDEYGLVTWNNTRYYLPALSKIRDQVKSDDFDNDFEEEKFYIFHGADPGISFREWTDLIAQVHGPNGIIGLVYFCSALFRDVIFERLDGMFPHLNLFGLPGSGKNQMGQSLTAPFGKFRPPVHCVNATEAAFTRRVSQVRNGIAWYDEYSNNLDHRRVESLKAFADGTGRARAQVDNAQRTTATPVVSAVIVSGQQQPTLDIALFTRCISLSFNKREFSDTKDAHARLKEIEKTGHLAGFVAWLQTFRPKIVEDYFQEFDTQLELFKERIAGAGQIMDRIVRSYAAMLTTYTILERNMTSTLDATFGFSREDLLKAFEAAIIAQREAVYSEDEISIWWRMVEFFLADGEIEHGADILVEEASDETYDLDWKGQKEVRDYRPAKRLVYVSFARTHPLYLERHQRQRGVKGLDMEALKYYLKASPAYQGWKKAKKFQGAPKTCFVFDAEKLPFELEDTVAVLARRRRAQDATEPPIGADDTKPADQVTVQETPIDETLPF